METIELKKACVCCHKFVTLNVKPADLVAYERGAHAQEAFPYLEPSQREVLISGVCPDCWNNMFGSEDDSE